jgi:hypothetical protein
MIKIHPLDIKEAGAHSSFKFRMRGIIQGIQLDNQQNTGY